MRTDLDVDDADAVLLDMDGVVVDSERHWAELEEERILPAALGDDHDASAGELAGRNYRDAYGYLAAEYETQVSREEFVGLYEDVAGELYSERADLTPAFPDLLRALRARRRVALVSSSPSHWIGLVTRRFDLDFDAVVSADDVHAGKPHPAVYERAARDLGVRARRCVAVEDSEHGVESAVEAGATTVGYRARHNRDADLSRADVVVDGPDELRGLLLD